MSFKKKELIPYINMNYPTTTYKTVIGHSLGGLTVMNTLLNKPDLFNSYVSLDGASWWNEAKVVKEAKTILPNHKKAENLFKLNIANNPNSGNCYDSIGDFYLATENNTKAIESFKKALTLADIPESKAKLEKLSKEKK